jgi:hypothetical protein
MNCADWKNLRLAREKARQEEEQGWLMSSPTSAAPIKRRTTTSKGLSTPEAIPARSRRALQARDQNQTTATGQSKVQPKPDKPSNLQAPLNPPLKQLEIVLKLIALAADKNNRLHGLTEELLMKVLRFWLQDQACGCYNYEDVGCHEIPVGCICWLEATQVLNLYPGGAFKYFEATKGQSSQIECHGRWGINNTADGIAFWDVQWKQGSLFGFHTELQWKQGDGDSYYDGVQYLTEGFGRLGTPIRPLKYVGPAGTKACDASEVGQRR